MRYTEADTLVTTLVRALEADHMREYSEPSYAKAYALGYLTSLMANMVADNPEAEQRVRDSLRTLELYTESVK